MKTRVRNGAGFWVLAATPELPSGTLLSAQCYPLGCLASPFGLVLATASINLFWFISAYKSRHTTIGIHIVFCLHLSRFRVEFFWSRYGYHCIHSIGEFETAYKCFFRFHYLPPSSNLFNSFCRAISPTSRFLTQVRFPPCCISLSDPLQPRCRPQSYQVSGVSLSAFLALDMGALYSAI